MREVHFFVVMIANQRDRIFQHGHHAEPEQINLDEPEVGAILFIPLHDDAAGHAGGLQRHNGIKLALADHHASGVLPKMAWQVLNLLNQLTELSQARISEIESRFVKLMLGRAAFMAFTGVFPTAPAGQTREASERGFIHVECLAHIANRRTPAIRNHVGRHRRAAVAVALIDVLNRALAIFAAGQIEIDIGPFAAFFGKKTLEEQVHADWVHGGDAERITDRAIGRRAAPLHQNSFPAAELDDIPDDQEIAGEAELLNQCEFALNLLPRPLVVGTVAVARAFVSALSQERIHRLAGRHGVLRELITEIVQSEFQAR